MDGKRAGTRLQRLQGQKEEWPTGHCLRGGLFLDRRCRDVAERPDQRLMSGPWLGAACKLAYWIMLVIERSALAIRHAWQEKAL